MAEADTDVVVRFVKATQHLSQEEAADLAGVSQRTISNWRRGRVPSRLAPATRRRLLKILEEGIVAPNERKDGAGGGSGAVREPGASYTGSDRPSADGLEWLPRLLELLVTSEMSPEWVVELTDRVIAAAKMQVALWDASAAYGRSVAMQADAMGGVERAATARTEAVSAASRWAAPPQGPGWVLDLSGLSEAEREAIRQHYNELQEREGPQDERERREAV
jgi:transcriptional regulator with XRE-family HTH domain